MCYVFLQLGATLNRPRARCPRTRHTDRTAQQGCDTVDVHTGPPLAPASAGTLATAAATVAAVPAAAALLLAPP